MPDTEHTGCVVVGGGPAGAILSLLLAPHGVPVTLLEAHRDFDREFRGDTVHPSVMDILEQLGLAESLLQLPHTKVRHARFQTPGGDFTALDFRRSRARHPYIVLIPQSEFLEFVTARAAQHSSFRLKMGARVRELIEQDGVVHGVRYESGGESRELRATLTVATDGRFSTVRRLAGLEPVATAPPMDVLWFRLSRHAGDPADQGALGRVGGGHILILLDRRTCWQVGYVIPKDGYRQIRDAGIEAFRCSLAAMMPWLADRLGEINEWKDLSLLSVESSRLPRWYRPGLLIGDAAHVMSPVGGVGINYAIQDAVEAFNVLAGPLHREQLRTQDLAEVQRRRELPTRLIQTVQAVMQRQMVARALRPGAPFRPPLPFRLPGVRSVLPHIAARVIGWGFRPARIQVELPTHGTAPHALR